MAPGMIHLPNLQKCCAQKKGLSGRQGPGPLLSISSAPGPQKCSPFQDPDKCSTASSVVHLSTPRPPMEPCLGWKTLPFDGSNPG